MTPLLSLLLSALPSAPAPARPAADFYVAPGGNDAWSGTRAEPNQAGTDGPFATPGRARDAARQLRRVGAPAGPVNVMLRGGRYELEGPLTFTPADSGTKRAPLLFEAYPREVPVLSGGVRVRPKVESGLWELAVPWARSPVRHITVGGQLRLPARWPKEGQFTISGLAGANPKANYRTAADRFEYAEGQIDPAWKSLTDVEVVVLHFWVAGHYRIKSVDAKARVVTLDRASVRRFTEDHGPRPGRFYLRNVADKVRAGEFHHDLKAGVIRYRPKAGETADGAAVVVPRLDAVVRFDGQPQAGRFVEHVELRGLTVSDSTFELGAKSAGDFQAAQHVPGAVRLRGARHCAVADCRLVNLGGYGLELGDGCRGCRVTGNELAHLAAGGVRVSGGAAGSAAGLRTGENEIADNHIHHLGAVFHAGVGVLSQHADRNAIRHNHIHHLDYTGVSVGWVWGYGPSVSVGNFVEGNRVHDVGRKVLSDMGGVYLLGVSPGTVVRGNVVRDVESFGYGGWGIYTDEGSTGVTVENNLVYRTKSGGFHQHYGKANVVRNNIFALAREGQVMRSRAEAHVSFRFERNVVYAKGAPLFAKNWKDGLFEVDHNLYWDASGKEPAFPGGKLKDWQARGHDRHSLVADPLFVDPEKGDFRLKAGSPAGKVGFKPFDYSAAGVRPRGKR